MRHAVSVGLTIDGFKVKERLATGGTAQLWAVERAGDPNPLVMKVPRLEDSDNPLPIVSFEAERMILPHLSGPHVPRFVAAGDFTRLPYLVMERLPGQSLKARLPDLPLPFDEVAAIGVNVATALHDLHQQHVVHLDVKPSNVMLRDTGEAVLIDFGFARHEQLPDLLAEEFREPFGTTPYMAPEQVLQDRSDPRSDLFAIGAMLYFFVTGERPYGTPQGRGIRRRLWREPLPPRARRPDCPPWLQEAILRCLEIDPQERYATAAQLAMDLRDPAQMQLTARAARLEPQSGLPVFRRWLAARRGSPENMSVSDQLSKAPIILVAVDLSPDGMTLADPLRVLVKRVLALEPDARLACINVLKTSRIGIDVMEDAEGQSLHLKRLIELKHWSAPIDVPVGRLTCSVLEAADPASAIVDYARHNRVDHIVIGARSSSGLRRYLGSVSSQVVAEAPCSVTVVRAPRARFAMPE